MLSHGAACFVALGRHGAVEPIGSWGFGGSQFPFAKLSCFGVFAEFVFRFSALKLDSSRHTQTGVRKSTVPQSSRLMTRRAELL